VNNRIATISNTNRFVFPGLFLFNVIVWFLAYLSWQIYRSRLTVSSYFNRKHTPFRRMWLHVRRKNNGVYGASLTYGSWKSSSRIRLFITCRPPATRQKRKGITVWWTSLEPRHSLSFRDIDIPGVRHSRSADNTGRNKNYTLISVSHDALRAGRDGDFPSEPLAPQRRNIEGSIMRTAYQMSQGLPRSDTVTKIVIVWSTSAGETSRRSLLHSILLFANLQHWHACSGHLHFLPNATLMEFFKSPNFKSSKLLCTYWNWIFLDFNIFLKFKVAILIF